MTTQLLRIGTRYINMANVVDIQETGANVVVTLTSIDNMRTDDDLIRHESGYIIFSGDEALALTWYLLLNSVDIMGQYKQVTRLVNDERDDNGALDV